MKKFILTVLCFLAATLGISAQCPELSISKTGKVIVVQNFEVKNRDAQRETILTVEAAAEASWAVRGAESPVLTVFVDGKYNQDLMLFAGAEKFTYRVLLGGLAKGKHTVTLVLNEARSASNARRVKIYSQRIFSPEISETGSKQTHAALASSPIIYARPNAIDKFTDIPLITYYEIFPLAENHFKIRYTTIFTNEDGGTQTAALMARWGRPTDIEWVYEIEFKDDRIAAETYQGANHETKKFTGRRLFGSHPVIYTVTDNNNFSDSGCSALRAFPLPIQADLSGKSRESIMDQNPWTYRVMAEEARREERIKPQQMGANTIDDLRNYLYVEVYSENTGAAVAVEAGTKDGKTSRSDLGDARLRIDRSGYKRIAVRLPSTDSPLESLSLICQPVNNAPVTGDCQNARIIKFIRLDENYRLSDTRNSKNEMRALKPQERLIWRLAE